MAFDFSDKKKRHMSVGLTSMIDVIFILIVFFMLVSSFGQYRVLDLVTDGGAQLPGQSLKALKVVLGQQGQLMTQTGEKADAMLAEAVASEQPVTVILKGSVPLQQGVQILDRLKGMGVKSVALVPEVPDAN
ncbi:biopolymer transporter ExbD [uncultured Cohaesibacter sp.]|uniref:ExbD/TolR family protein n=1 Tax=uncultured Cohaesibacter sp. TaxID=1002546 RepID=UPI00292CBACE|nr:biopolymer transporter ExbD [uncultured Cohaesibacter sp.]